MIKQIDQGIPFAQDSADEIVSLLKKLLEGKKFTSVEICAIQHFYPQVFTGKTLQPYGEGDSIQSKMVGQQTTLVICDSYTTWPFSTTLPTQDEYDSSADTPYFSFREGHVIISQRKEITMGHDYLVLAVEE